MKILFLIIPIFLYAEIDNKLLKDCSLSKKEACAEIGNKRMDKMSPEYDPSLALSYLETGCNVSSKACLNLSEYYEEKNDIQRSRSYLKKACDLKSSYACMRYHRNEN